MQNAINAFILSKRAARCVRSTIRDYSYYLDSFYGHCGKSLAAVANGDIEQWIVDEGDEGLAPASVRALYNAIRAFLNWCVENELIEKSPLKMKAPPLPVKAPRVASLHHVQRLLDISLETWKDYRDRALVALLLDTGMRIGEALSLSLSHVNLSRKLVHIPAGKNKRDRHAPFTDQCADTLAAYLDNRPGRTPQIFLRVRKGEAAGRMLPADAQWMMKMRCRDIGIDPYVNLHSIRHLFAMKALNDGIRVEVVSKILGHHSVDFTLKLYAHLLMDTIQREYNQHWRV